MKIETKKIIAREFLFLISTLVLGVVFYLSIFPFNVYQKQQADNLRDSINSRTNLADSLSNSIKIKLDNQFWFTDKYLDRYNDLPKSRKKANDKIWFKFKFWLENDSIIYNWDNVWDKEFISFLNSIGFKKGTDFQYFIQHNVNNRIDSLNNINAKKLSLTIGRLRIKENTYRKKLFSSKDQWHISVRVFMISLIFLFGLRYIFFGIKWSISTLQR
jgi:hypothetical protein